MQSHAEQAVAIIDRILLIDWLGPDTVLQLIDLRQRFIVSSFSYGSQAGSSEGDYRRIQLIDRVLALGYLKPELSDRVVRLQTRLIHDLASVGLEVIPN